MCSVMCPLASTRCYLSTNNIQHFVCEKGKKSERVRQTVQALMFYSYQTSGGVPGWKVILMRPMRISHMFTFSFRFPPGATVVSWRVNNQEQLFVR